MASVFIFMICWCHTGNAQKLPDKNAADVNSLINKYVYKNYKPDSAAMADCCEKGFLFVKFSVSNAGQVTGLSYTTDSPLFIQEALARALKHIELDIFLMNAMKKTGATYLLPVVYDYNVGCHFDKIPPGDKYFLDYMMKEGKSDRFHISLLKMLSFPDGYYTGASFVILSTINVGSPIL